jgi:hypothetical protein
MGLSSASGWVVVCDGDRESELCHQDAVACGRFTDCRSMVTCCLSTRFSRTIAVSLGRS